jgi:hypothetical protein
MSSHVDLALLLLNVSIVALIGVLAYFGKGKLEEINRNTRFRREVAGDQMYSGEGRLDDFDTLTKQLKKDHDEVRVRLKAIAQVVESIRVALNNHDDLDVDVDKPDNDYEITDDD